MLLVAKVSQLEGRFLEDEYIWKEKFEFNRQKISICLKYYLKLKEKAIEGILTNFMKN